MRLLIVVMLALGALLPARLTGQVAVAVSAGARYSSALVRDSIVAPLHVRPTLAPTVAVTVGTPLERGWAAQVALDFSTGDLRRHDADGSIVALGRMSTAAFSVALNRRFAAGFSAGIGIGGLKYFPGEDSGIFRLGGGSIAALGTLMVSHALTAGRSYGLSIEARYDVHGFTTPALRADGFTSARAVHRVALAIRADRRGAR